MANVLGELFQDIADAIRSKTGSTDTLKPNQFPAAIEGITAGGGEGEKPFDCHSVTFVYGDKSYVRSVADGDTCADPVERGLIPTPTKESTAQYNYTYYGWGASDGGAADANILKNITSDKTVYAIFTATVRYYTITYLDDDGVTVLKTEQLAYGAIPSYEPTKEGAAFDGWTPSPVYVTGDATYTAKWIEVIGGSCGDSTTWSLDVATGLLTITGTGAVTKSGWSSYAADVNSVVIEEGITEFTANLFSTCTNVESIYVPASVTSIVLPTSGYGNHSSGKFVVSNDNANYSNDSYGVLFDKNKDSLLYAPISLVGSYVIPDSVCAINACAFSNCKSLTAVTIPTTVTVIEKFTFYNCSGITKSPLHSSITNVKASAFSASGLTSVTIYSSIKKIGAEAFYTSTLKNAYFHVTTGWWTASAESATSGTTISKDLSNTTEAAKCLNSYGTYWQYWTRN